MKTREQTMRDFVFNTGLQLMGCIDSVKMQKIMDAALSECPELLGKGENKEIREDAAIHIDELRSQASSRFMEMLDTMFHGALELAKEEDRAKERIEAAYI